MTDKISLVVNPKIGSSMLFDKKSIIMSFVVLLAVSIVYISLALFSEKLSFGADRDDFLVAYSAQRIAHHQSYEPSRLPGAPLFERMVALSISSFRDARPAKIMIAFCSIIMVGLVMLLGFMAGGDRRIVPWSGLLFAVVPVWVQTSFVAMDYSLSLLMITVAALILSLCPTKKPTGAFALSIVAGVFLALGISARLTAVLFLPAAVFVILFDNRPKVLVRVAVLAGFTISSSMSLLFYKPIISLYGIHFLSCWPAHYTALGSVRAEVKLLFALAGGIAGAATIAFLGVILFKNLKGHLKERVWNQQGWGIRTFLLFSFLNTLFYLLLPNKITYYLPLLPGVAILFAIGLRPKDRPFLLISIALLIVCSFVQIEATYIPRAMIKPGLVMTEWKEQKRDKLLFEGMEGLLADSGKKIFVFGFPATDRMLVWFFDKTAIYENLPHPDCWTMWGAKTVYPEPIYSIGRLLATDPPQALSKWNTSRLENIISTNGINEIVLIRSPIDEPVEIPNLLCQYRHCRELKY